MRRGIDQSILIIMNRCVNLRESIEQRICELDLISIKTNLIRDQNNQVI